MNQPDRYCDSAALARTVSGTFALGSHSIHGPSHWRRVERNGLWLAERSSGDVFVVRLFAWFHDSCRVKFPAVCPVSSGASLGASSSNETSNDDEQSRQNRESNSLFI